MTVSPHAALPHDLKVTHIQQQVPSLAFTHQDLPTVHEYPQHYEPQAKCTSPINLYILQ